MPLIDAHVHLYPPEVNRDPAAWAAANGERHWAALCTRKRKKGAAQNSTGGNPVQLFPSMNELLRDMDSAGIGRSILLGWYWERPENCVAQNRFYAECVRTHPDRLSAFATVHPAAGNAALEDVRRAHGEGLIGLGELSPHSQRIALDDPTWLEIIALAGELNLPVNLHVTDPDAKPYPGRVETPQEDFITLALEFPATKFILAHWGGGLAFDAEDRALSNLYYDSAASSLMYDGEIWLRAVEAVGAERIIFGSDNPLRLYPKTEAGTGLAAFVHEARTALTTKEGELVLGGNAQKLLNLS
jgi:predicted TIM-barrel fold metal-dependent hydrolase